MFGACWYLWPSACFGTHLMFNISFCCCRHNVSNIFVQLTEGRSARDQPKQPPAKKKYSTVSPWQGNLFGLFSTEVGATQGGITGAQITINSALSAFQSSPCLAKAISCMCLAALAFPSCRAETLRYPNCSPF